MKDQIGALKEGLQKDLKGVQDQLEKVEVDFDALNDLTKDRIKAVKDDINQKLKDEEEERDKAMLALVKNMEDDKNELKDLVGVEAANLKQFVEEENKSRKLEVV